MQGKTDTLSGKRIVHRVEDGDDRDTIAATTYQMRNFYKQLEDGFFSNLDTMNYIQHHWIARALAKPGMRVLDACCGRGLMLPLLRYYASRILSYTGLDIEPANATWREKRVTDDQPIPAAYYPFATEFIAGNIAEADRLVGVQRFDLIIYTSSLEHMHKEMGEQSLRALRAVAADGAAMILTCPNTPEGQDGTDTQYRAHVYEWKRSELLTALPLSGWQIVAEYGLLTDRKSLEAAMIEAGAGAIFKRIATFVPPEWYIPVLAPAFPQIAKEIGYLCRVA